MKKLISISAIILLSCITITGCTKKGADTPGKQDPNKVPSVDEFWLKSNEALRKANSVQIALDAEQNGLKSKVDIRGKVDGANQRATGWFEEPAKQFDLITADEKTYLKTPASGGKYQISQTNPVSIGLIIDSLSGPASFVLIDKTTAKVEKGEMNGRPTFTMIDKNQTKILVDAKTMRPIEMVSNLENKKGTAKFSDYDAVPAVSAPPAGEVDTSKPAPGFDLPTP